MSQLDTGFPGGAPVRITLAVLGLLAAIGLVYAFRGVLAPFLLGFVLAYILTPLVDRMEASGLERTASILIIFATVFVVVGLVAVTAGGRLTGEIVELGERLLRREYTERELSLTNLGNEPLVGRLVLENDAQEFRIDYPTDGILELEAGTSRTVRLRFTPPDTSGAYAMLVIKTEGGQQQTRVALGGNGGLEKAGVDPATEDQTEQVGNLLVGARAVDFGTAGPNLLTNLSQSLTPIQPLVDRFLGEDFDMSRLVALHGRSVLSERLLIGTTELLGGLFSGLTFVVLVPFIAFFFLREGNAMTRGVIELVPNAYFELCLDLLHQISQQIGGYLRGQLLATSVVATLGIIGLQIIGVDYAVPLGLLAGIANMIPFLGPLIGIISATAVTVATGGGIGVVGQIVVLYLFVQGVDNFLVQPTIVARSVKMHPLAVLGAVMVGSQLMGIVGMLIAVPLFGIAKVSAQTLYAGLKGYRT